MPVTVTNLQTSAPLWVPLAGGGNIRLAPGATSAELPDDEVADSAGLARLAVRGVVEVRPVAKKAAKAVAKPAARKATTKRTAGRRGPAAGTSGP
jgi:hypothetical protein